jgi:hypothetical protein
VRKYYDYQAAETRDEPGTPTRAQKGKGRADGLPPIRSGPCSHVAESPVHHVSPAPPRHVSPVPLRHASPLHHGSKSRAQGLTDLFNPHTLKLEDEDEMLASLTSE